MNVDLSIMKNIRLNDLIEDFTFNKIFIELIRLCDTREIWLDNILFDNACNGIKDSTDIDKDISIHSLWDCPEHRHTSKVH